MKAELKVIERRAIKGRPTVEGVTVECSECGHTFSTVRPHNAPVPGALSHLAQHGPGRALDIEVSWDVYAECSVCEGDGCIVQEDDGLLCQHCGTTWGIDGTNGYRP